MAKETVFISELKWYLPYHLLTVFLICWSVHKWTPEELNLKTYRSSRTEGLSQNLNVNMLKKWLGIKTFLLEIFCCVPTLKLTTETSVESELCQYGRQYGGTILIIREWRCERVCNFFIARFIRQVVEWLPFFFHRMKILWKTLREWRTNYFKRP